MPNQKAKNPRPTAREVIARINALESELGLDTVVHKNDLAQARALSRISPKTIERAAEIARRQPKLLAAFDGEEMRAAIEDARAMATVLERVMLLAEHLRTHIRNARYPAAQQTLAIYATLKSLARLPRGQAAREATAELREGLVTNKTAKKLSAAERQRRKTAKSKARRIARAKAHLDAVGA